MNLKAFKMNKKKIISVSIIFFIFSLLQINDPDSYIWIIIYFIPSLLSLITIINYKITFLKFISCIYLFFAIYVYINNNETNIMYLFSEKFNESLGLLLCSFWIFLLSLFENLSNE